MNQKTTYKAVSPDTLDLAERAELALHGIAETTDPNDDYLMWFDAYWNNNPPFLQHSGCDIECAPKFLDAMAQLRVASGSDKYYDVEQAMLRILVGFLEDDGLYYARYTPHRPWHLGAYAHTGYKATQEDYAIPGTTGVLMTALAARNQVVEPNRWDNALRAMARGLDAVSLKRDDYAFFPDAKTAHPFCRPRSGWPTDEEPEDEHGSGEGTVVAYFGYPIRGLSMWAAQASDGQALELAGQFARFVMQPKFWGHKGDPHMVGGGEQGHVDSHLHARAIALRGLLEYGIVAGDMRACDFVRSSYEHMRIWGINRIGFIPTWVNGDRRSMEGCLLGDLVALTVRLSEAGLGDYWDDADRVIRNHLVEAQFTDRALLEQIVENTPRQPWKEPELERQQTHGENTLPMVKDAPPSRGTVLAPHQISYDRVLERCVGILAAYLLPTSALNWRTMQCCTANAARGLYYAWEAITRCTGEEAQVNLLLNRAAPWLDVESHLPYEGKVVIHNKACRRIAVRIPAWVNRRQLRVLANGLDRPLSMIANYATVDLVKPGDVIELRFPVAEETVRLTAHARTQAETLYTICMRGNTVVDISPRDQSPTVVRLYRRGHMKAHKAPMKSTTRTVLPHIPKW